VREWLLREVRSDLLHQIRGQHVHTLNLLWTNQETVGPATPFFTAELLTRLCAAAKSPLLERKYHRF